MKFLQKSKATWIWSLVEGNKRSEHKNQSCKSLLRKQQKKLCGVSFSNDTKIIGRKFKRKLMLDFDKTEIAPQDTSSERIEKS